MAAAQTPPEFPELLIKHAELCWKAEEANSSRIAVKNNLVLAGIIGLLGLKLHQFGSGFGPILGCTLWIQMCFWIPFGLGVFVLFWALKVALEFKVTQRSPSASAGLNLADSVVKAPLSFPDNLIATHVFRVAYRSYLDLQDRNEARKQRIDQAQSLLFMGFLLVTVAVAAYATIAASGLSRLPNPTPVTPVMPPAAPTGP